MKLAFLSSIITDGNPTSGYEIANEALVHGLKELDHDVTEIGFRLPRQRKADSQNTHILGVTNFENAAASTSKKLEWIYKAIASGLPISSAKLPQSARKNLDRVLMESGPFDGLILNSYQMAAAYPELLKYPHIYVSHNVEHRSATENALRAKSRLERFLYRRDARLLKELEKTFCDGARFVWTFSETDLDDHGVEDNRGYVLPLVAPLEQNQSNNKDKTFDLGLIGTWSWQPNFIGLKWFLEEVVPQLSKDISIGVAGGVPSDYSASSPNVTFLGRVESASHFLQSVSLVPLVSKGGTGVQLKTIEALQKGFSCVATSSSLRGIEQLPENCVQADGALDFAQAIEKLLELEREDQFLHIDGRQFYDNQRRQILAGMVNGLLTLT